MIFLISSEQYSFPEKKKLYYIPYQIFYTTKSSLTVVHKQTNLWAKQTYNVGLVLKFFYNYLKTNTVYQFIS